MIEVGTYVQLKEGKYTNDANNPLNTDGVITSIRNGWHGKKLMVEWNTGETNLYFEGDLHVMVIPIEEAKEFVTYKASFGCYDEPECVRYEEVMYLGKDFEDDHVVKAMSNNEFLFYDSTKDDDSFVHLYYEV